MLHTALDSAKKGIEEIEKDSTFVKQLAGLLISLKQLKADILWKIRQSDIEELQSLNEEILVGIRLYIENKQQRLENLEKVYERMANLYYYFEQEDLYDKWDKLYSDCLKALEPYDNEDEEMNWDHNEEELNNAIASIDISGAGIEEDGSTQKKMEPILTVRVALNINKEEKMLSIQVFNDTKCISWLMEQVSQRAWEEYGYEPKVYELKTEASGSLSPQVLVVVAIQGNFELVYACYDGKKKRHFKEEEKKYICIYEYTIFH
ncbi:hypothetical protein BDC45DRAFT_50968 [Circinella umbellata]|nr:hypothetical protein BDC45DRAFT_50968 [Circinella umbellata]